MTDRIPILDHGYLQLVESWGSDERVIESARMSTNKGFLGWGDWKECWACDSTGVRTVSGHQYECYACKGAKGHGTKGDEKLLRYLWDHKHATPWEMSGLTIEVQAPIFVFREWHRHRTQSFSELSARYTEMPELFYVPSVERLLAGGQSKKNKQGSGQDLNEGAVETAWHAIDAMSREAFSTYNMLLSRGLSRELARVVLPVNTYSRMRASANLRNWLAFLTLRMDPAAQYEIRVYAEALATIVAEKFPRTWALFEEGFENGK